MSSEVEKLTLIVDGQKTKVGVQPLQTFVQEDKRDEAAQAKEPGISYDPPHQAPLPTWSTFTVRQLIETLQKCNQDAPVYIWCLHNKWRNTHYKQDTRYAIKTVEDLSNHSFVDLNITDDRVFDHAKGNTNGYDADGD